MLSRDLTRGAEGSLEFVLSLWGSGWLAVNSGKLWRSLLSQADAAHLHIPIFIRLQGSYGVDRWLPS